MCLAVGGLVVLSDGHGRTMAAPSAQALRTCVDRWNQNNMVSWGSMAVRIAIRGLNARERDRLSIPNPGQRRCTVSLAGGPGDNTWICQMGDTGGYDCPLVTSDGMPPLRNPNGTTDHRGVLKLDVETISLQRLYVLFFIEFASRRVPLAGCTANPIGAWVTQQARQFAWTPQEQRHGFGP
jgi:hypothetical protein